MFFFFFCFSRLAFSLLVHRNSFLVCRSIRKKENAVKLFQTAYGLAASGVFDAATAGALLANNSADGYSDDLQFPLPAQYLYKVHIPVHDNRSIRTGHRCCYCCCCCFSTPQPTYRPRRIDGDALLAKRNDSAEIRRSLARPKRRQRSAIQSVLAQRRHADRPHRIRLELARSMGPMDRSLSLSLFSFVLLTKSRSTHTAGSGSVRAVPGQSRRAGAGRQQRVLHLQHQRHGAHRHSDAHRPMVELVAAAGRALVRRASSFVGGRASLFFNPSLDR